MQKIILSFLHFTWLHLRDSAILLDTFSLVLRFKIMSAFHKAHGDFISKEQHGNPCSTSEMLILYELADSSHFKRVNYLDFMTGIFQHYHCPKSLNLTVIFERLMGWKGKKSTISAGDQFTGTAFIRSNAVFWTSLTLLAKQQVLYWQWQFWFGTVHCRPVYVHISLQFMLYFRLLKTTLFF